MNRTPVLPRASRLLLRRPLALGALAVAAIVALPLALDARGEDAKPAAKPAGTPPQEFDSKEDAAKALIEATGKNDDAALAALTGSDAGDVVQSGKDPQVEKDRAAFAAAAKKKLKFEEKGDTAVLVVGDEEWPFPIPLVQANSKWHFDAAEGRQEILARRIGRNELRAIKACRDYVSAQVEYATKDRDGDKVREYAQKLLSTPGKQDGLYWEKAEGGEASPLASALAPFKDFLDAPAGSAQPFMGYTWRILGAQGANAPGGAYGYVLNGNMIAGFALIGVPAVYRNTGVMTLMVSNHGTIYQKDLGPQTIEAAKSIVLFDPDATWTEVGAEDLAASTD